MLEYYRLGWERMLLFTPMPEMGNKNAGLRANNGYWRVKMITPTETKLEEPASEIPPFHRKGLW